MNCDERREGFGTFYEVNSDKVKVFTFNFFKSMNYRKTPIKRSIRKVYINFHQKRSKVKVGRGQKRLDFGFTKLFFIRNLSAIDEKIQRKAYFKKNNSPNIP
jgi:hypothetical protein